MRKLMAGFLLTIMVFALTACGNSTETDADTAETGTKTETESAADEATTEEPVAEDTEDTAQEEGNGVLVAYFQNW